MRGKQKSAVVHTVNHILTSINWTTDNEVCKKVVCLLHFHTFNIAYISIWWTCTFAKHIKITNISLHLSIISVRFSSLCISKATFHHFIPNKSPLIPKVTDFLTFSLHDTSTFFHLHNTVCPESSDFKAAGWSGVRPPPCLSVLVQGFESEHQAFLETCEKSIYTLHRIDFPYTTICNIPRKKERKNSSPSTFRNYYNVTFSAVLTQPQNKAMVCLNKWLIIHQWDQLSGLKWI